DPIFRNNIKNLYDDSIRQVYNPREGLWLEALADDIVSSRSFKSWQGYDFSGDEVDVLGVIGQTRVLIECKDTNLGRNDLYVALNKAKNLRAELIILTTKDIHPNVQSIIRNLANQNSNTLGAGTIIPTIISSSSADVIRNALEEALDKTLEDHLTKL